MVVRGVSWWPPVVPRCRPVLRGKGGGPVTTDQSAESTAGQPPPSYSGDPAHLRGFHDTNQEPSAVAQMLLLLDLQDEAESIRRLRRWAVDAARPVAGETVVDVGSGSGTMVRRLAALVGATGRVTGVEPNPRLREVAVARSAGAASAGAASAGAASTGAASAGSFVDGFAAALPFADGSVDLVWCERVLQHLADPQGAVLEIARVLRPGGRAVLLDTDHASRVTSDIDLGVEAILNQAFLDRVPNARSARSIPRQVAQAGLALDDDIGSAALVMPPSVALMLPLVTMMAAAAGQEGWIPQQTADEAIRRYRAAAAEGVAFSAVTVFGFVARKAAQV